MQPDDNIYRRSFKAFAQAALDSSTHFIQLGKYALLLHGWAEQLVKRASLNNGMSQDDLEREIYEEGRRYIRRFSSKFKAGHISS